MSQLDEQTQIQESEYSFPYHYIPALRSRKFSHTRYWSWGFRYLGGIQLVLDQLAKTPFSSLIDIGCGDGRFLREVSGHFHGKKLLGIDASARAVRLAHAFNPEIEYRCINILDEPVPGKFDVATLIEVIEHIPPERLPEFLRAVAGCLSDTGCLIITVPHQNKPLIKKHYQHFTSAHLKTLLEPLFSEFTFIPFDVRASRAPLMWVIERILGAKGKFFLLTNPRILYFFYALYRRRYLYTDSEKHCERIAIACVKKPPGKL